MLQVSEVQVLILEEPLSTNVKLLMKSLHFREVEKDPVSKEVLTGYDRLVPKACGRQLLNDYDPAL